MSSGIRLGFLAVLICTILIRCIGLDYSVPYHFHIDEHLMLTSTARFATDPGDAVQERHFFNYGSVTRMPIAALLRSLDMAGKLDLDSRRQVTLLYLAARMQSVLYGTLTVLFVMLIAFRIGGGGMGLFGGVLLAFSPLHLRDSHFFTADIPLTFWITITVWMTLLFWNRSSKKNAVLAGICAGLAMATKLNAAPALLPLLLVTLSRERRNMLLPALGGFIGGFFIGNWPIILDPGNFIESIRVLSSWASGNSVRQPDLQFVGTTPWIYWITNLLFFGAGPILLISGLFGCFLLPSFQTRINDRNLIMVMGIAYFLFMGLSFQKFMRFSLPLHPFLAVTASCAFSFSWERMKWSRYPIVILLLIHVGYGTAYGLVFTRIDPRIQAGNELSALIPDGSTVLLETTHSNPPLIEADRAKGFRDSYLPELGHCTVWRRGKFNLLYVDPYRHLYDTVVSPSHRWMCLMSAVDRADLIIIGPRYRDQYRRLADTYPAMARFYQYLDAGLLGFELARIYENPARIGPLVIHDERSELTFRLFDRPYLRIYTRHGSSCGRLLCDRSG